MGFPHSDTHGSTLFWQLTVLFRGLNRPSSPTCPKASTSCPESLIINLSFEIILKCCHLILHFTLRLFADLRDSFHLVNENPLSLETQIVLLFGYLCFSRFRYIFVFLIFFPSWTALLPLSKQSTIYLWSNQFYFKFSNPIHLSKSSSLSGLHSLPHGLFWKIPQQFLIHESVISLSWVLPFLVALIRVHHTKIYFLYYSVFKDLSFLQRAFRHL